MSGKSPRVPGGTRTLTIAELRSAAILVLPSAPDDDEGDWMQSVADGVGAHCEQLGIQAPLLVFSPDPAAEWELAITTRDDAIRVIDKLMNKFDLGEVVTVRASSNDPAGA